MQAIARKFRQVAKLMKHNDNLVFSGCGAIAREYLFKPVFIPVHLTA